MSKVEHAFLRKALYMPTMVILYHTLWGRLLQTLARYGQASNAHHRYHDAQAHHIAFGVLKSGKPFDPALYDG